MPSQDRIVTALPLGELWTPTGRIPARHVRSLDRDAVRDLLRSGPVRFVVANVGLPLRWIDADSTFAFWKSDARFHIAHPARFSPDDFPQRYAYLASEWCEPTGSPIVLLEMHH